MQISSEVFSRPPFTGLPLTLVEADAENPRIDVLVSSLHWPETGEAAWGIILKNSKGRDLGIEEDTTTARSSTEATYRVIETALKRIRDRGQIGARYTILSNSKTVVGQITGKRYAKIKKHQELLFLVKELINDTGAEVRLVERGKTKDARTLAKAACKGERKKRAGAAAVQANSMTVDAETGGAQ